MNEEAGKDPTHSHIKRDYWLVFSLATLSTFREFLKTCPGRDDLEPVVHDGSFCTSSLECKTPLAFNIVSVYRFLKVNYPECKKTCFFSHLNRLGLIFPPAKSTGLNLRGTGMSGRGWNAEPDSTKATQGPRAGRGAWGHTGSVFLP